MNLARREKYSSQGRNIVKNENIEYIDINFDLNVLNLFSSFILSENSKIKQGSLISLRNLMEIINLDIYKNDMEKIKRINFIKKGLEARILKKIRNPILVIKYINGGIVDEDLIDTANFTMLSNEEINYVNEVVSKALKYAFIYNDVDKMLDVCTRFKAADYISRANIVEEIECLIKEMMTKFRRVSTESISDTMFSLRDGHMEERIVDIYNELSNPNRRLITGMQGINELLGGGFECTRVYTFVGNTGSKKSITLLNFAVQIKKYNKNYIGKDPTKKPVIVYLTQENQETETVQRLFEMSVGKGDLTNYTPEQIVQMLRTEGELYLSDESSIDIIVKFVPDKSVDTSYLYTFVEDLEDEGYEVICLIQDHLKKIRSCFPCNDLRLELGNVLSEFKTFASIKGIPVITNTHLNRDGAKSIDEGLRANKYDLLKQVGRSNIGESYLIMDNTDYCCFVGPEFDCNGNEYMAFKRTKIRGKATLRDYIVQPFTVGNSIKLVEDFYSLVPIFKETLKPSVEESELYNTGINNTRQTYNSIKDIDEVLNSKNNILDMEDDNIFNSNSRYSMVLYEDKEEEEVNYCIAGVPSQPILFNPMKYRYRNVV